MKKYIDKANVLIEALPYIQRLRGKTVIIKYGGSVIGNNEFSRSVLQDIVFLECIGINPVLIHGGGHAINRAMKKHRKQPKFINGLRITDKKTMEIVEYTLMHQVNAYIVNTINSLGGNAQGISGKDVIMTKKHLVQIKDEKKGTMKEIDLGFVGDVVKVNPSYVSNIINNECVPVIAPIGLGEDNKSYNVNADIAAGKIAGALKAEKLVFLTDIEGIMTDVEDKSSLISSLKKENIEDFISRKIINGGMIPKANSCLYALTEGVKKTHIIDGRISHSLLLEIFTDRGIGTEIVK